MTIKTDRFINFIWIVIAIIWDIAQNYKSHTCTLHIELDLEIWIPARIVGIEMCVVLFISNPFSAIITNIEMIKFNSDYIIQREVGVFYEYWATVIWVYGIQYINSFGISTNKKQFLFIRNTWINEWINEYKQTHSHKHLGPKKKEERNCSSGNRNQTYRTFVERTLR